MKQRKIPMRKCIGSQEMKPKKELIRIVKTPEGEIAIDVTGKKSGRGAYLSKDVEVINSARKKNILQHHLKAKVDDSIYAELITLIEKEKQVKQ